MRRRGHSEHREQPQVHPQRAEVRQYEERSTRVILLREVLWDTRDKGRESRAAGPMPETWDLHTELSLHTDVADLYLGIHVVAAAGGLDSVDDTYGTELLRSDSQDEVMAAVLAALTQAAPHHVAAWIRAEPPRGSRDRGPSRLDEWWGVVTELELDIPEPLIGAVALLVADEVAWEYAGEPEDRWGPRSHSATYTQAEAAGLLEHPVVQLFGLMTAADERRRNRRGAGVDYALIALRNDVEDVALSSGMEVASAVAWLLRSESFSASAVVELLTVTSTEMRAHVAAMSSDEHLEHEVRNAARGLHAATTRGSSTGLHGLAQWGTDNNLRRVPHPLHGPSSTWLDDGPMEDELRDTISAAADDMPTSGLGTEEKLVGALLQELSSRLAALTLPRQSGNYLDVSFAEATRTKERQHGADLGILMDVQIHGQISAQTGHLVQIKIESGVSRKTPGKARTPRWVLKLDQLDDVLDHDVTATYWLLSLKPRARVLVVPASYLAGLAAEQASGQASMTVHYTDVRSASIPLGQALCELIIGMWLGSRDPKTIKAALNPPGQSGGTYGAKRLLRISMNSG